MNQPISPKGANNQNLKQLVDNYKLNTIKAFLIVNNFNISVTARALGIHRNSLIRYINKYDINISKNLKSLRHRELNHDRVNN